MSDRWTLHSVDSTTHLVECAGGTGVLDAIVCDPPYDLHFMAAQWDRPKERSWHERWLAGALISLKPGGHLVAFGGTRTHHRLWTYAEEVGFEVRDTLSWMYGQGFPKSLDVAKAMHADSGPYRTEETKSWQGWGTALKPAWEPILLARKPLDGTVVENAMAHGTGALNVDGCRVGTEHGRWPANVVLNHAPGCVKLGQARVDGDGHWPSDRPRGSSWAGHAGQDGLDERLARGEIVERWQCVPDCPVSLLNRQAGTLVSGDPTGLMRPGRNTDVYGEYGQVPLTGYGDVGGASRFFYCAKAPGAERDFGCEDLAWSWNGRIGRWRRLSGAEHDALSRINEDALAHELEPPHRLSRGNVHPTVKPLDLMRWLVRLVARPDALVMDPFAGSGTTGMACLLEGMRFVGIENDQTHVHIARRRIAWAAAQGHQTELL